MLTIGLSGLAGAGKDLFCQLLIDSFQQLGIKAKRYALADELKLELRNFMIQNYGIDVLNCSREEKELIRPLLVFHGNFRRNKSEGRCWTSRLENTIKDEYPDVAIITDIRYDQFEKDEVYWLKEEMAGVLVHISQYSWVDHTDIGLMKFGRKVYLSPPNEFERENDPKVKAKAAYSVEWEKVADPKIHQHTYVADFIGYLKLEHGI
jgi:hypothetical protein